MPRLRAGYKFVKEIEKNQENRLVIVWLRIGYKFIKDRKKIKKIKNRENYEKI